MVNTRTYKTGIIIQWTRKVESSVSYQNIFTTRQRSCGKVIFSQMSVFFSQGVWRGPHVTITHNASELTVQAQPPPPPPQIWDVRTPLGPPHPLVISGSHDPCKFVHWVSLCRAPHPYWHLLATEARTFGKCVLHILLECFLELSPLGKYS